MIGTIAEVREKFFDRQAVMDLMDSRTHAMLMKFGAYTRRTAQQSIRSRQKSSAPGTPPSNHTGKLRDNIYFIVETARSVVIGPTLLPPGKESSRPVGDATVPSTLEAGGRVIAPIQRKVHKFRLGDYGPIRLNEGRPNKRSSVRRERLADGQNVLVARVKLKTARMVARATQIEQELVNLNLYQYGNQAKREVTIGPRPFMAPAFQKELGVLDTLWQTA